MGCQCMQHGCITFVLCAYSILRLARIETRLARNETRLAGNETRLAGNEKSLARNVKFLASALQVPRLY